jgi:hypothetical protein
MPEPEYFEKKCLFCINNIEILCDDEEFVYDKSVYCHLIYQAVEKTVINPIIFSK